MRAPNKCKDCTDRYPGCHGECDNYKEYRKTIDEMHEAKNKRTEKELPFIEKRMARKTHYFKRKYQ